MTDNAVIEREAAPIVPAQTDASSFLQLIERASRDPTVDVDKMERLMAMHERLLARQAETAFNAALSTMQTELPEMPEHGTILNKSGGVQSKYARWEDINKIIKPILSRHGFALSFSTGNDESKIVVTGTLSHSAGHSIRSTFALPADTSGSKNEVQGQGSSIAYGKRYVASALLNLTSRESEDMDGADSDLRQIENFIADWRAKFDEGDTEESLNDLRLRAKEAAKQFGARQEKMYLALKPIYAKRLAAVKA